MDSYHTFVAEATCRDRVRDRLAEAERERLARRTDRSDGVSRLLSRLAWAAVVAVARRKARRDHAQCPTLTEVDGRAGERTKDPPIVWWCDVMPARTAALEGDPAVDARRRKPPPAGAESRTAHLRPDGRHLQARYGL